MLRLTLRRRQCEQKHHIELDPNQLHMSNNSLKPVDGFCNTFVKRPATVLVTVAGLLKGYSIFLFSLISVLTNGCDLINC